VDEAKLLARVPTAEHREPCESRGSRTVLGARGGEIPPRDSTNLAVAALFGHGRFTPDSRHESGHYFRPFRASCVALHCSKQQPYSITSSARASSVGGIIRPSVLVALRLIANPNLVGACMALRCRERLPPRHLLPCSRGRYLAANAPRYFAAYGGSKEVANMIADVRRSVVTHSSATDRRSASNCARGNGQISPSTTVRDAKGAGSRRHPASVTPASVLLEDWKSANIYAKLRVIRGISVWSPGRTPVPGRGMFHAPTFFRQPRFTLRHRAERGVQPFISAECAG
jgi:hypothetical protein